MALEKTILCRVESVRDGGAVHQFPKGRILISVSVDVVDCNTGGSKFRGTLEVDPDEQPKVGDRYTVHIAPSLASSYESS